MTLCEQAGEPALGLERPLDRVVGQVVEEERPRLERAVYLLMRGPFDPEEMDAGIDALNEDEHAVSVAQRRRRVRGARPASPTTSTSSNACNRPRSGSPMPLESSEARTRPSLKTDARPSRTPDYFVVAGATLDDKCYLTIVVNWVVKCCSELG